MPLKNNALSFNNVSFQVGETVEPVSTSLAPWTTVAFTVDRTVNAGLNSLTSATLATVMMEYSTDNGVTWILAGINQFPGGTVPLPARLGGGPTLTQDFGFSVVGQTYPAGTQWRIVADVAGPSTVKASGTVTWE